MRDVRELLPAVPKIRGLLRCQKFEVCKSAESAKSAKSAFYNVSSYSQSLHVCARLNASGIYSDAADSRLSFESEVLSGLGRSERLRLL